MTLSPLSLEILKLRYLNRDKEGTLIETPAELFFRVANNIALADMRYTGSCEKTRETFVEMLQSQHFVPASPILMNAGTPLQQLFSDHVLSMDDSIESIFSTLKRAAIIHQNGSGCGFSFTNIRPRQDTVGGRHKVAFGPVTVMRIFEVAFNSIKQSGRRPGANMGVLHVSHPDVPQLISCKREGILSNFNISILLTDNFMNAVQFDHEHALINPRTMQVVKKLPARQLFRSICENAWSYGDPGLLFIDKIREGRTVYEDIVSTSSCGQAPLAQFEAIPYGHINLATMANSGVLDENLLRRTIRSAVHFLDNCLDMNQYLFAETEMLCKANRKIGLGVMGFADLLATLSISYASEQCIELIEKIGPIFREESRSMSAELAEERGVFLHYDRSTWNQRGLPMRNAMLTCISPTGSTSLVANTTCGIEPLFALSYSMKTAEGTEIIRSHPLFEQAILSAKVSDEVLRKVAHLGSAQGIEEIPLGLRQVYLTSRDVKPEWHIKVQAAWQKYIDGAISKTINLPKDASVEDVSAVYKLAHASGCKGITVYRDGSRTDQILELTRTQMKLDSFKRK